MRSCLRPVFTAAIVTLCLAGCKHDPVKDRAKFLKSGIAYEKAGKHREALIQFSNSIKADPGFAEAHHRLALTLIQLGSPVQAYKELLKTVELEPSNLQARVELAEVMIGGGLTKEPADQVNAILQIDAHNADAHALRSRLAAKAGNTQEATTEIREAVAAAPKRAQFHEDLALLLLQGKSPNVFEARSELEKAVECDRAAARPHLILAALYENMGNKDEAERELIAARSAAPKDPSPVIALALHFQRLNRTHDEEAVLLAAANDMPNNTEIPDALKQLYLRTAQQPHAVEVFTALHNHTPANMTVAVDYVELLQITGQGDKARTEAQHLLKTNAHDPAVVSLNASLMMTSGRPDDAFTLLQGAVKDNPANAKLKLLYGRVAESKNDIPTAEKAYEAAVSLEPANTDASAALASVAIRQNDYTLLAHVSEAALQFHPDYSPALLWRAIAEASQSQPEKAESDAREVLHRNPRSTDAYLLLAQLAEQRHRETDARKLLETAYGIDPLAQAVTARLNALDTSTGHQDVAVGRLKTQLDSSPNNPSLYTELAALQLDQRAYREAQESALKALSFQSNDPRTIAVISNAAIGLNDTGRATEAIRQWLAAHPNDATATAALGNLAEHTGSTDAIALYRKTVAADPENAMALNNLAYLMTESGQNLDEALTYAQRSQRLTPHLASSTDTLAWVYYRKGSYREARELLTDAETTDPRNASVQLHLGLACLRLDQTAEGIEHLKKAVKLASPASSTAKDATAALSGHV